MKDVNIIKNENKRKTKTDKASIHVRWTDNGQIMMELVCDPDEIEALYKLFDFVSDLNV